jgi:aspartyl protease family protein
MTILPNTYDNAAIAQYTIILAAFAYGIFALSRQQIWARAKMLFAWFLIIIALLVTSVYWEDLKQTKFYASLVPGHAIKQPDGSLEFYKAEDGHFHILARVNGQEIEFMLDTGASDIVLTQKDAKKLGIDVENLNYNRIYNTANGQTRGASIALGSFEVGDIKKFDLPASVNEGKMDGSLLGMSFLEKLHSFKIEGNKLTLYK